jgi:hypothetical protein
MQEILTDVYFTLKPGLQTHNVCIQHCAPPEYTLAVILLTKHMLVAHKPAHHVGIQHGPRLQDMPFL